MQVFITGGSGYIGRAVVRELVRTGHRVTALARSPERAALLERLGAMPWRGSLRNLPARAESLATYDCLIHLAYDYGASHAAKEADADTIMAFLMGARLRDDPCAIIYTSNALLLAGSPVLPAYEDAPFPQSLSKNPCGDAAWRPGHEEIVLAAANDAIATAVIRVGVVYGGTDENVAEMFDSARRTGVARYVGTGRNRWSLIHRDDLAALYRTVAERRARGVFHGVDGLALTVEGIARSASMAAGAKGKTQHTTPYEARKTICTFADVKCLDVVIGERRGAEIGWRPARPSFTKVAPAAYKEWVTAVASAENAPV